MAENYPQRLPKSPHWMLSWCTQTTFIWSRVPGTTLPRVTLAEVTLKLISLQNQPNVYSGIANPSRGRDNSGGRVVWWASFSSAGRVTLASGTTFRHIECVRMTSWNSQIQNKRASKGFILIRHKRYQIYTCLQLSSSIASFVWKPAHFKLRSYGGAWHNTKIAFVEKYTLISWFLAILGV